MDGAYSFMNTFMYTPNTWNPYPVYDDNGAMRSFTNGNINNYLWVIDNTRMNTIRNRFIPTAGLSIKFLDNLVLSGRFGLDYFNNFQDKFADNTSKRAGQLGIYQTQKDIFSNFNSDIMLNYNTAIGSKFKVDALIGHNAQYRESITDIVRGSDFIISGFADMSNVKTKTPSTSTTIISSVGVYGQLVVDYNSLLYYTFTARNDWVSTLSPDNRSYFYPSNSLSFIFSELFDSSVIGFGKLRLSHANAGIPASPYQTYTKYVPASGGGLTFPYNGLNSYILGGSAGNPALQPEMTSETAMGLDMVFLNNRLGFEATIYNKVSRNQMIFNSITAETGVTGTMMNVGELQNKGVELLVTATPVKSPSFSWDITTSYSANRNKVIKISDNMTRVAQAWGLVLEEGHPFPSINLIHWVEDGQGNRLVWDNPSSALYGHWMRSDHVYRGYNKPVGKIEPDWFGSIRNTFSYKGLTLTGLVTMKFGGRVHNMDEQYLAPIGMSIKTENRSEDNLVVWPGVLGNLDANGNVVSTGIPNTIPTSFTRAFAGARGYRFDHELKMQPSDIIRLNELTLRYQLPKQVLDKIGYVKGMNISLTGNNIWRKVHDNFTGSDPDFSLTGNTSNSAGLTIWMFPSVKTYTAGVAVNF